MLRMKKLSALLLTLAMLAAMSTTAFAVEVPDPNRNGSISLKMEYDGKAVSGGALTAYRVGEISEDDGNYSFALSLEFAASGADLSDLSSATAQKLADFAKKQNLTGTTETIGTDGEALFSNVKPGLYLIIQSKAASGYEAVSPFLVSVPMNEDGVYIYDVDATPKVETLKPAGAQGH